MSFISKEEISYSLALFDLEKDYNKLKNQSHNLLELINKTPELISFLNLSNSVGKDKNEFIDDIFKNKISKNILIIIKLLTEKRKLYMLNNILKKTIWYCNEKLKIVEGIAYTTIKLTSSQIKKMEKKLSKITSKKIVIINLIDNFIVGGIKVVIEDKIWDYSIVSKIENMKRDLKEGELF